MYIHNIILCHIILGIGLGHSHISFQVCIPGLHISLGIFNLLFTLLENACHELDLQLAEKNTREFRQAHPSAGTRRPEEAFRSTVITEQVCRDSRQLLVHLTLSLPDPESNIQLRHCIEWITSQQHTADEVVNY